MCLYLSIINVARTIIFTLKVLNNLLAHLNSHVIYEMQHVVPQLAHPPAVCLEHLLCRVQPLIGGPGAKVVEPWDTQPSIHDVVCDDLMCDEPVCDDPVCDDPVCDDPVCDDPCIQVYKVLLHIYMTWRAIVGEPDHLIKVSSTYINTI